jgi:NAD(P)-dependent dehydrogenase (short-subunit alcohol dehydrogenase family)
MSYRGFDKNFSLDGKVAVITGAAAGIGCAIATLFAEKGARLVLVDIDEAVKNLASNFSAERAVAVVADVTDSVAVEALADKAIESFGTVDILVNSAGVVALEPAAEFSEANWDRTLAVNLKGVFLLSQAFGRHMLERGCGRIINLASQAGVVALDKHLAYCVSKAGVISMTKVLALEWSPQGIQVNAISPTVVMTELGREAWAGEVGEQMKRLIPARRFAEPEEIAAAALFLASDAAAMITGENLMIDGGYTIQ